MKQRTDQKATQPFANVLAASVKYVWVSRGQEDSFTGNGVAVAVRGGTVTVGVGTRRVTV